MGYILIGKDDLCCCDGATKCPRGHIASMARCSRIQLEKEGYRPVNLKDVSNMEHWKLGIGMKLSIKLNKLIKKYF